MLCLGFDWGNSCSVSVVVYVLIHMNLNSRLYRQILSRNFILIELMLELISKPTHYNSSFKLSSNQKLIILHMFYPVAYQLQTVYYFPYEWAFPIQTNNQNFIKVQDSREPIQEEILNLQPQQHEEHPETVPRTSKKLLEASSNQQENDHDQCAEKKPKKTRIQSVKKNTETNILSQVFSFLLSPSRSQKQVQHFLGTDDQQKIKIFYAYMKSLKKLKSKYLNKKFLLRLIFLPEKSAQNRIISRSTYRNAILNVQQLRKLMYKLVFYFLRNMCINGVLESKRIRASTIKAHLQKRRQFLQLIKKQTQQYF